MIGKIKRGKSFKGVCDYVLRGDKDVPPKIIGGNMAGSTPAELAAEFEMMAARNGRVQVPVKHFALAFSPEDGELTDKAKANVAAEYMERMGYGNSQYVVVGHDRSDHNHKHDHLHIVANAVAVDSKWVNDRLDFKQSKKVCRALETQFGLTPVTSAKDKNRDKSASAVRDRRVNRLVTSGVPLSQIELDRQKIQAKIDIAAPGAKTMSEFCARLQTLDIQPIPRITRTGQVQGVSYKCGEVVVRGSDLDDASFPSLQSARGIGYEELRDLPSLRLVAKGGQLETNKDWTDRLPEIEAEIATQTIIPANQSENIIFIDMDWAQAQAEGWALAAQEPELELELELEPEPSSDWGR